MSLRSQTVVKSIYYMQSLPGTHTPLAIKEKIGLTKWQPISIRSLCQCNQSGSAFFCTDNYCL